MELNQLKYFILVAELQNLSRASEQLNISQPALSKSILKLEKELGTPLFERLGKKIILNEQGSRFFAGVQASLQELDDTMSIVASISGYAKVKLNIGIFAMYSEIIRCLKKFGETRPMIEFVVHSNISALEHLDTDTFDMMVYPLDSVFKKYKGNVIAHEKFKAVMSRKNPLSSKEIVSITELEEQPFAFIRNSKRSLGWPYHLLINAGLRPQIKFTTDDITSHCQLLSSGSLVGLIPEGNVEIYAAYPDLVFLDIEDVESMQPVLMGFRREKHLSAIARDLRDFAYDYFENKII